MSFQAMGRPRNALFTTADVYRSEPYRKIQHRGTEDNFDFCSQIAAVL